MRFYLISIFLLVSCGEKPMKSVSETWFNDQTIYEVNIRQYTEEGTIRAFRSHLPRLKSMGVGILWMMPIHPIGEINRKGTLGSYYSVKNYYEINPEFGTLNEFKNLVDEIHEHGMYVIIDWVANHTSWDNSIVGSNPEWYTKDLNGNFMPPKDTDWSDVVDLDFSKNPLRRYMIDAMKYWIKEIDIDGFRCDVAGMVPNDFWKKSIKELNQIKPIFMLAEWEDPQLLEAGFNADYNWTLYHNLKDIASGTKSILSLQNYLKKNPKSYPKMAIRMNFLDNHDENSWGRVMIHHFGSLVYPMMTLNFTLPGIPMIYSGQEAKLAKKLEFFEKDTIDWNDFKDQEFYTKLINLKKSHSVFWTNNKNIKFLDGLEKDIIGFKRWNDESSYIIIINFSNKTYELNDSLKSKPLIMKDVNSSNSSILPYGYKIFGNENR